MNEGHACLFVYGTLRAGFDGAMAQRLQAEARHVGRARAKGALYRVEDYPGFVPGDEGLVTGDLFALTDAALSLPWLDDYEQCSPDYPAPQEYRRVMIRVDGPDGPVMAWTYIFAHPVEGLARIGSGDFLTG